MLCSMLMLPPLLLGDWLTVHYHLHWLCMVYLACICVYLLCPAVARVVVIVTVIVAVILTVSVIVTVIGLTLAK
jgi:hypothetical protein